MTTSLHSKVLSKRQSSILMTFLHRKSLSLRLLHILCFLSLHLPPHWSVPYSSFGLLFNSYLHCIQQVAPFLPAISFLLEEAISAVANPQSSPPPTLKVAVSFNGLNKLEHFCQQSLRFLQGDILHHMQVITCLKSLLLKKRKHQIWLSFLFQQHEFNLIYS